MPSIYFHKDKVIVGILGILIGFPVLGRASNRCSEWQELNRSTCVFARQRAKVFQRSCENPCGFYPQPECDKEKVCYFESPIYWNDVCTPWTKVKNTRCQNPETGALGAKWERACTVNLAETWCSNSIPNQ